MKVLRAIREGWALARLCRKAWLIWYLTNTGLAVVAIWPVLQWLKGVAGRSLDLPRSSGHSFTFISDLLRNHGESLPSLIIQASLMICGYLLVVSYLSGGILHVFRKQPERFQTSEFLRGGSIWFWRMFGLGLTVAILYVVLLCLAVLISTGGSFNPITLENDVALVNKTKMVFGIAIGVMLLIKIIQTIAKVLLVRGEMGVLPAFRDGLRFVFKHFGQVLTLFLMTGVAYLILISVHYWIKEVIPSLEEGWVLLLLLAGQIFLFLRIGVRLWVLGSVWKLAEENDGTGDFPKMASYAKEG